MAVFKPPADTFETAFERGLATAKKVTTQAVKTVAGDIREQMVGNNSGSSKRDAGVKELPPEEKRTAEAEQRKLLDQTRMNLEQLNKKILEIKAKRMQKDQETLRQTQGKAQQKKYVEERKKVDFEKENIRKKAAHEILKGVSG